MKKYLFLLLLLPLAVPALTHAASPFTVSTLSPYQGDTLVVKLPKQAASVSATFLGKPLAFFPYRSGARALAPIVPTERPGYYTLRVRLASGATVTRTIHIRKKKFPEVVLGVPDKLNESPAEVVQQFG